MNYFPPRAFVLLALALPAAAPPPAVKFTDITAAAGIKFVHNSGRGGKKYMPETMGSGAAFLDVDNDGWPAILLINSKDFPPRRLQSLPALYRSTGNVT